jgi:PhzF family phenazine biosynthesis protein
MTEILRYAAFTTEPSGGNPAGVVLDAQGLDDEQMQRIAADVGFSETAFLWPGAASDEPGSPVPTRYFSPVAEVPFCGHATIATAVAHAERHGPGKLLLRTQAGDVAVATEQTDGGLSATLTSVPTRTAPAEPPDVDEALATLRWSRADLDPSLPPHVAYAGAEHLVLAASTRSRLADLDYDFDRLLALMTQRGWTTVALVHRTGPFEFAARNPFPVGGVVEDPATGAAAAALGGYLRDLGRAEAGTPITVRQGDEMGRPSVLIVDPYVGNGQVAVTGHAVPMD